MEEYANGAYVEEKQGVYRFQDGEPQGEPAVILTRGPHFDAVTFKVYEQQLPAIIDLRSDLIDYILSPQGIDPSLRKHLTGPITTIENPASQVRFLGFNLRRAPFDSREFRQALGTLIDREFLANIVLQKIAFPVHTFVPETNRFWLNPDALQVGRDLTREQRINNAVGLLEGAGFSWDQTPRFDQATGVVPGLGIRLPNGEPMPEITLMAPAASFDPLRASAAVWIERWLNEAGIPVKTRLGDSSNVLRKVFGERDFEMALIGGNLSDYPAYLEVLFQSEGGANAWGYQDADFDALVAEFLGEPDLEPAQSKARQLQTLIAEDLPVVALFNVPVLEVYRGDLVQWAFTDSLNGLQRYFQNINGALSYTRPQE